MSSSSIPRLATVFCALCTMMTLSCSDSSGIVLLSIDARNLTVPDQLDELEVTLTASKTDAGELCAPLIRDFTLESSSDLPLWISIEAGVEYDSWVALRVLGFRRGVRVIQKEKLFALPSSDTYDASLDLQSECYELGCGLNEHCDYGYCIGVPLPGVFEGTGGEECEL